jgi:hypothetical protein
MSLVQNVYQLLAKLESRLSLSYNLTIALQGLGVAAFKQAKDAGQALANADALFQAMPLRFALACSLFIISRILAIGKEFLIAAEAGGSSGAWLDA